MRYYQLSPHIYMEFFDEDAVMLVAYRDLMITVNPVDSKPRSLKRPWKKSGEAAHTEKLFPESRLKDGAYTEHNK